MINDIELETKPFIAALVQMRETELAHLLGMVETLVEDFQCIPQCHGESAGAVAAAQTALKTWNDEINQILKMKQMKNANS